MYIYMHIYMCIYINVYVSDRLGFLPGGPEPTVAAHPALQQLTVAAHPAAGQLLQHLLQHIQSCRPTVAATVAAHPAAATSLHIHIQ